jgi:hypothetical protein
MAQQLQKVPHTLHIHTHTILLPPKHTHIPTPPPPKHTITHTHTHTYIHTYIHKLFPPLTPLFPSSLSFKNHIRALHALHQVTLLLQAAAEKKHFTGVIYVRADVLLLNPVPFFLLQDQPKTLFLPDFHRSCRGGENMTTICILY